MKYLPLLIFCAVIFLLCFLIDLLLRRLFPRSKLESSRQTVRPSRLCSVAGVILLAFPTLFLLGNGLPEEKSGLFLAGCITAYILGVILLGYYFSFTIYYDEEKFLYKTLFHGKREFSYADIRGQRSLLTRSGVHTTLFVADTSIELTTTHQNVAAFLSKAFYRWCSETGVDPNSVENNPRYFTWFPEPADEPAAQPEETGDNLI